MKRETPTADMFMFLEVKCHRPQISAFPKCNRRKVAKDLSLGTLKFEPGLVSGSNG